MSVEPVPYPVPSLEDLRAARRVALFKVQDCQRNRLEAFGTCWEVVRAQIELGIEQAEKEIDNLRKDGA